MTRTRQLPRATGGLFRVASHSQVQQMLKSPGNHDNSICRPSRLGSHECTTTNTATTSDTHGVETASFIVFPKLPVEIQTYIWEIAHENEPQRVVVVYSQNVIYSEDDRRLYWSGFVSPTPIPAILQACSSSRAIASRTYKLSFGMTAEEIVVPPMIYFNHEKDILYFRQDCQIQNKYFYRSCIEPFLALVNRADIDRVENIGFHSTIPGLLYYTFAQLHTDIKQWKGIRKVYIGSDGLRQQHKFEATKPIAFKELHSHSCILDMRKRCFNFAQSCENSRNYGNILNPSVTFINGIARIDLQPPATDNKVEELLDWAKISIEKGITRADGVTEAQRDAIKPSCEAHFGTFQNI